MSLLLLFHPRSGAGPTPAKKRYDGQRPQDEDDEELAIVLALFRRLAEGEDNGR